VARRLRFGALTLSLAFLLGCGGSCSHTPVPRDDEPRIRAILDADKALDRALKEADDESAKGNDTQAADLLESKATPAADDAIKVAEAQTCLTPWGNDQKSALLGVLHERHDAIPVYAKALRGDDLDAKLAAVEKQIDIEKRAIDVAQKASQTP
jgi:hypothetical protein